jgi:hypothetical protein
MGSVQLKWRVSPIFGVLLEISDLLSPSEGLGSRIPSLPRLERRSILRRGLPEKHYTFKENVSHGKTKIPHKPDQAVPDVAERLEPDHAGPTITSITLLAYHRWRPTTLEKLITDLEAQLNDKRKLRDAQFAALWDKAKRIRNSIKGSYGDDSPQYDLVGGTRLSDRKPYRRKTTG